MSRKLSAHKGHLARGILVGFCISVFVTLLAFLGHFKTYENPVTAALQALSSKKASDIVLLFITKDEYQTAFDAISPLSRKRLAQVIDTLIFLKAKVIALDIDLSDSTPEDHLLTEAFGRAADAGVTVVVPAMLDTYQENMESPTDQSAGELLPYTLEQNLRNEDGYEIYNPPDLLPEFQEKAMHGGALFRIDNDGVFRNAEAFYLTAAGPDANGNSYLPLPSFPLAVAAAYRSLSQQDVTAALEKRAAHVIHIQGQEGQSQQRGISFHYGKGGRITPNFTGNYELFERDTDVAQLLASFSGTQQEVRTIFADKIVLVGGAYDKRDFYFTPLGQMSGMEIIANVTQSILSETIVSHLSFWKAFALEILIGIFVAGVFAFSSSAGKATLLCIFLLMPVVVGASVWAFSAAYYWFDFLPTYAGVMFHGIISRIEEKKEPKEGR